LLVQYILVGLILSRLVRPDIAILKVMIGAFICPILFLSARQVSGGLAPFSLFTEKRGRGEFFSGATKILSVFLLVGQRSSPEAPATALRSE